MEELTAISLFSGIAGDTIAAQWAGFKTLCFVEWDIYCQAVLKARFPGIPIFGDIDEFDTRQYRGTVTLVYGGDPCQPNSIAGKCRGSADNRYKWPSMLRVIRECQPTWVVNENPTGRLTVDFYQVLSDLEGEGYETRSFVIPACAVNAPHRRDRVYIIAHTIYSSNRGWQGQSRKEDCLLEINRTAVRTGLSSGADISNLADTLGVGKSWSITKRDSQGQPKGEAGDCGRDVSPDSKESGLERAKPEGEICAGGLSPEYYPVSGWQGNPLEVAAYLCRVDDGFSSRVDRLKVLGNAQVPQQIYPIFKGIAEIERMI